jgi:hypothetical protein
MVGVLWSTMESYGVLWSPWIGSSLGSGELMLAVNESREQGGKYCTLVDPQVESTLLCNIRVHNKTCCYFYLFPWAYP